MITDEMNADCWRWFLAWLNEDEPWYPLPVARQASESESAEPAAPSEAIVGPANDEPEEPIQ